MAKLLSGAKLNISKQIKAKIKNNKKTLYMYIHTKCIYVCNMILCYFYFFFKKVIFTYLI